MLLLLRMHDVWESVYQKDLDYHYVVLVREWSLMVSSLETVVLYQHHQVALEHYGLQLLKPCSIEKVFVPMSTLQLYTLDFQIIWLVSETI